MPDLDPRDLPNGLEKDFGWLLSQVLRRFLLASDAAGLSAYPGGGRGFLVLLAATEKTARNQVQLARRLGIDRTVMVYLLDELVAAGLIERRLDPLDRRNRLIVLTEAGRTRLAEAQQAMDRAVAHLLAPLPEAERASFTAALHRLVEHHYRGDAEVDVAWAGSEEAKVPAGTGRAPRR